MRRREGSWLHGRRSLEGTSLSAELYWFRLVGIIHATMKSAAFWLVVATATAGAQRVDLSPAIRLASGGRQTSVAEGKVCADTGRATAEQFVGPPYNKLNVGSFNLHTSRFVGPTADIL